MTTSRLVIDAREREWIQLLSPPSPPPPSLLRPSGAAVVMPPTTFLFPPNVDISTALLPCGDAHLYVDDALVCIVERKTLNDLLRSQEDTRLNEQLARLEPCSDATTVVLLVEGRMDLVDATTRRRIWKTLESVRHAHPRIDVRTTSNLEETIEWVGVRLERHARWTVAAAAATTESSTVVQIALAPRKASITPAALVAHLLSCVPGLSHATAEAMRAAFGWTTVAACVRDLADVDVQKRVAAWSAPTRSGAVGRRSPRRLAVLLEFLGLTEKVEDG